MNVTLLALGSRGDVQPAIALGVALKQQGYAVRLASYTQFEALTRSAALDFSPIDGDITSLLSSPEGQAMLASRNPLKLVSVMRAELRRSYHLAARDVAVACAEADVILSLGAIIYAAASEAEQRGIPYFHTNLQPLYRSRAFPNALLPPPPIQTGGINRLSHLASEQIFWQILGPLVNQARSEFYGLAPFPRWRPISRMVENGLHTLFAYSRHVLPKPTDWPENVHVTGYWFLDQAADWQPPPALQRFLAAGAPPVYIGFGSMNTRDPQETAELVLRALELSGQRGILLTGWGGLQAADLPETVFMIDSLPHDWLFPRTAAVVHHGGAGTTAAGLRAGVPSLLIPFFADQPFWGQQVARLGVGPHPLPRRKLTAQKLAQAITTAVANPNIRTRAAALGEKIRAENGVANAVRIIESQLTPKSFQFGLPS